MNNQLFFDSGRCTMGFPYNIKPMVSNGAADFYCQASDGTYSNSCKVTLGKSSPDDNCVPEFTDSWFH